MKTCGIGTGVLALCSMYNRWYIACGARCTIDSGEWGDVDVQCVNIRMDFNLFAHQFSYQSKSDFRCIWRTLAPQDGGCTNIIQHTHNSIRLRDFLYHLCAAVAAARFVLHRLHKFAMQNTKPGGSRSFVLDLCMLALFDYLRLHCALLGQKTGGLRSFRLLSAEHCTKFLSISLLAYTLHNTIACKKCRCHPASQWRDVVRVRAWRDTLPSLSLCTMRSIIWANIEYLYRISSLHGEGVMNQYRYFGHSLRRAMVVQVVIL